MIQTASILWAILATGGAVAVYILMRREVAKARKDLRAVSTQRDNAWSNCNRWRGLCNAWWQHAVDLDARLQDIKAKRHQSAKHARAAQIAQQRAKVLEQASKLVEPKALDIAA